MRKFKRFALCTLACTMMFAAAGCGKKEDKKETASDTDATTEATTEEKVEVPELDGYTLLWNDEFTGTELDFDTWSYDPHEPGWTNNELQEYTMSTDNVFVKDGNLVLKAIKSQTDSGKDYYTSGKIKSQGKQDFMYGRVEVRAKVPEGQGLWPAIWMMPTDESFYGQWPKCGEIDIMETLGNQTEIAYGTVHYGEPHAEQQGTVTLEGEKFSDDFHVFCVEWEPGEMRWYIDDELYLTVNDWFSAVDGEDEKAYPAPFNQTFFVQLNLAVGGNWPGNPDETTDFDKAEFLVDYVRVYQKPSYDTNVKKPEKVFREPLEDGNLVYNGDFADAEDLTDDVDWKFLLFEGGEGSAKIENGEMIIESSACGTVDYSVQLVQPDLPMLKGHTYRLTYEAMAEGDRPMVIAVTAPTAGWGRYLSDTRTSLTTEWQEFEFTFEMTAKDDNNGRLEFNMGGRKKTDTIHIRNVRIEDITETVAEETAE